MHLRVNKETAESSSRVAYSESERTLTIASSTCWCAIEDGLSVDIQQLGLVRIKLGQVGEAINQRKKVMHICIRAHCMAHHFPAIVWRQLPLERISRGTPNGRWGDMICMVSVD
jgi:hypothetical protein